MNVQELTPARKPAFYFVGVTTGKSSIMRVFPRWAEYLKLGDYDGLTDIYAHLEIGDPQYNALFQALIGAETPPETVSLTVATQPYVNVIWAGAALMSVGILVSLLLAAAKREPPGDAKIKPAKSTTKK